MNSTGANKSIKSRNSGQEVIQNNSNRTPNQPISTSKQHSKLSDTQPTGENTLSPADTFLKNPIKKFVYHRQGEEDSDPSVISEGIESLPPS
jgi:hypothetical protein